MVARAVRSPWATRPSTWPKSFSGPWMPLITTSPPGTRRGCPGRRTGCRRSCRASRRSCPRPGRSAACCALSFTSCAPSGPSWLVGGVDLFRQDLPGPGQVALPGEGQQDLTADAALLQGNVVVLGADACGPPPNGTISRSGTRPRRSSRPSCSCPLRSPPPPPGLDARRWLLASTRARSREVRTIVRSPVGSRLSLVHGLRARLGVAAPPGWPGPPWQIRTSEKNPTRREILRLTARLLNQVLSMGSPGKGRLLAVGLKDPEHSRPNLQSRTFEISRVGPEPVPGPLIVHCGWLQVP